MKILVTYYSKTGNTAKIAEKIARELKADLDVTSFNEKTSEMNFNKEVDKYDLVIVGGPVQAFNLHPAMQIYLKKNKTKINRVAFFCTYSLYVGNTFKTMKNLSKVPIAELKIKSGKLNSSENQIKEFCRGMR